MPNTTLQQNNMNLATSGNVSNASEELNDISKNRQKAEKLLETEQEIYKKLHSTLTTDDFLAFKKSGMDGSSGSCKFLDTMDSIAKSRRCVTFLTNQFLELKHKEESAASNLCTAQNQ